MPRERRPIERGLNGQVTPFYYGWIDVPDAVEKRLVLAPVWDRGLPLYPGIM